MNQRKVYRLVETFKGYQMNAFDVVFGLLSSVTCEVKEDINEHVWIV